MIVLYLPNVIVFAFASVFSISVYIVPTGIHTNWFPSSSSTTIPFVTFISSAVYPVVLSTNILNPAGTFILFPNLSINGVLSVVLIILFKLSSTFSTFFTAPGLLSSI